MQDKEDNSMTMYYSRMILGKVLKIIMKNQVSRLKRIQECSLIVKEKTIIRIEHKTKKALAGSIYFQTFHFEQRIT